MNLNDGKEWITNTYHLTDNWNKPRIFAPEIQQHMTKEELFDIIASNESFRIELTTSTGNMDKF